MVKFAGLSPTSGDIDKTFKLCESFIKETKPVEQQQEVSSPVDDVAGGGK
jgi:hypothetical protein